MSKLGLELTVPIDANRRVMEQMVFRTSPRLSEVKPGVQRYYIWEGADVVLAIGVSSDHPDICLGDYVNWPRPPNTWSHRNGMVIGFRPDDENCVLMVEEGKSGVHAAPIAEVVSAATAWHRSNGELLDPKLAATS